MKPEKIYKYQPINNYTLANLKNNQIWFSKVTDYNDPFDMKFSFNEQGFSKDKLIAMHRITDPSFNMTDDEIPLAITLFKEHVAEMCENIRNTTGVSCFSEKSDNILMWSHYASNHKGFCLEFTTEFEPFSKIKKIIYTEDYPTLFLDLENENISNSFYSKSKLWEYEKEWRLLHGEVNKSYGYDNRCLTGIFFGAKMEYVYKEIICLIIQGHNPNVNFYEAYLSEEKYFVDFGKVNYTPYIQKNK